MKHILATRNSFFCIYCNFFSRALALSNWLITFRSSSGSHEGAERILVALLGSPRSLNTYSLLKQLEKRMSNANIRFSILPVHQYKVSFCKGCLRCLRGDCCPIQDQLHLIANELRAADGIVLASPVYMESITAQLKCVVDRMIKWYHRPELVGKPMLAVATTGSTGLRKTLDYLEQVGIGWGLNPTGRIGRSGRSRTKQLETKEYGLFVQQLKSSPSGFRPSLKQLISFRTQQIGAIKMLKQDRDYWQKMGWNKQDYYYPCQIGWSKKIIASVYHRFLDTVVPQLE